MGEQEGYRETAERCATEKGREVDVPTGHEPETTEDARPVAQAGHPFSQPGIGQRSPARVVKIPEAHQRQSDGEDPQALTPGQRGESEQASS
jgi:hypothetical protein